MDTSNQSINRYTTMDESVWEYPRDYEEIFLRWVKQYDGGMVRKMMRFNDWTRLSSVQENASTIYIKKPKVGKKRQVKGKKTKNRGKVIFNDYTLDSLHEIVLIETRTTSSNGVEVRVVGSCPYDWVKQIF